MYKSYFTTGEFAALCNISKHTLYHYDDIGIFSPDIIAENGYRYYSAVQVEVFYVISILRELDMPLNEIKRYLDRRCPKALMELLNNQEKIIDEKIKHLTQVKHLVKKKALLAQEACLVDTNSISVESFPDEFLIMTSTAHIPNDEKSIALSIAEHAKNCQEIEIPYSIGGVLSLESIMANDNGNYTYFYTRLESPHPKAFIKKSGQYLVAYHAGSFYTSLDTYKRIIKYAQSQNIKLSGEFYEDTVLDELSVKGYDNYMLKISIAIKA